MPTIFVNFPFKCSCGRAGVCVIRDPVPINSMYLAPDCRQCGNTIVITPLRKLSEAIYEYNVRVCKTETENRVETPIG
jgi:hypothetical protein